MTSYNLTAGDRPIQGHQNQAEQVRMLFCVSYTKCLYFSSTAGVSEEATGHQTAELPGEKEDPATYQTLPAFRAGSTRGKEEGGEASQGTDEVATDG